MNSPRVCSYCVRQSTAAMIASWWYAFHYLPIALRAIKIFLCYTNTHLRFWIIWCFVWVDGGGCSQLWHSHEICWRELAKTRLLFATSAMNATSACNVEHRERFARLAIMTYQSTTSQNKVLSGSRRFMQWNGKVASRVIEADHLAFSDPSVDLFIGNITSKWVL